MTAVEVRPDRDALGRLVRRAWVEWAREQPNVRPSWLVPWEELAEADREADRRIGEVIYAYVVAGPTASACDVDEADDHDEVTRWLGTCPVEGFHIGIVADGGIDVPDPLTTTCMCGAPVDLRVVGREEYEAALGDDDPEADDDPDDGGPFRPRWPLLVSEDTKRELLTELAEIVHTPRPDGSAGQFARGYETGVAKVLLHLGINEAGSPERQSLPKPEGM